MMKRLGVSNKDRVITQIREKICFRTLEEEGMPDGKIRNDTTGGCIHTFLTIINNTIVIVIISNLSTSFCPNQVLIN